MGFEAACPRCGGTVVFERGEAAATCNECRAVISRKEVAGREDVPRPKPKKKRRKKARAKSSFGPATVYITSGAVLGLLVVSLVVWFAWPKKKPAGADAGTARNDLPVAAADPPPAAPAAPPWKAKEDPPASVEFPAKGFIPVAKPGPLVYQSKLNGANVFQMVFPNDDPSAKIPVFRIMNLHSGKAVCEVPQQYLVPGSALSDDGKRIATQHGPGAAEIKVYELPGLTQSKAVPVSNPRWYDFGKGSDSLLAAVGGPQHGYSIVYADLKAETPVFQPVPLTRRSTRPGGGSVALSPGRSFLAIAGERHVELVNLGDWTSAGILDAPGTVLHTAFSVDGKGLTIWSTHLPGRNPTPAQREQAPVQWTTFAMADGREVRKVEATASMDNEPHSIFGGPDAESVVITVYHKTYVYDLRLGAPFEVLPRKVLRPLDAKRYVVFDESESRIRVEAFDKARLARTRGDLQRLLGARPDPVAPDTKDVRQVADPDGWFVPVEPAPVAKFTPPATIVCPDLNNEFVSPRPDSVSWSAVVGKLETAPRMRFTLAWKKLAGDGREKGEPIPLWPCATEPGQVPTGFGYSMLRVDQTAANDKLALRDPKTPGRVDIWDDTGKRLVGFHPHETSAEVDWLAWARGDRLLSLAGGTLAGWDGPRAKAVFRAGGAYTSALLAPSRKWVAALGRERVDLLDTDTGKPLGRVQPPGPATDWPALGVSLDGARLYAVRPAPADKAQPSRLPMIEYACWDLNTGRQIRGDRALGASPPRPGTILHELNSNQLLVGNDVLDFSCNTAVATLLLPGNPADFPTVMIGNRLWCPVGTSRPMENYVGTVQTLVGRAIPDDVVDFPVVKPGDIVFRPGSTVNVVADLGDSGRSRKARDAFENALINDGFVLGDGGWKLNVTGTVGATGKKLTMSISGRDVAIPHVSVVAKLIAPDGLVADAASFGGSFGETRSKYFVSSTARGMPGGVTQYDFGGRDPATAMAEEAWDEAMKKLPFSATYPRLLARVKGNLVTLPIRVMVK